MAKTAKRKKDCSVTTVFPLDTANTPQSLQIQAVADMLSTILESLTYQNPLTRKFA